MMPYRPPDDPRSVPDRPSTNKLGSISGLLFGFWFLMVGIAGLSESGLSFFLVAIGLYILVKAFNDWSRAHWRADEQRTEDPSRQVRPHDPDARSRSLERRNEGWNPNTDTSEGRAQMQRGLRSRGRLSLEITPKEIARTPQKSSNGRPAPADEQSPRDPASPTVHTLRAVRAAGLDPSSTPVMPVNIGMMAVSSEGSVIYTEAPIWGGVDYVQPFVQLKLPVRAMGRVRFEIRDPAGVARFVHEEIYQLKRGLNLISPPSRFRVSPTESLEGAWTLRISADGMLLATHIFGWQADASREFRRHVQEDGELGGDIIERLSEASAGKMSLDELLSDQDEDDAPNTRRAER